jgi:[acyl-carrier-protein] S-malonyltransferase
MAAILGLDDEAVIAACREAAEGGVIEAVNFNCPGQVVIAGDAAAARRAIDVAKARGAKRAVPLPVSVPSHSSLMRGAGEKLRAKLATLTVRAPAFPYVSAVDTRTHAEPADIVDVLVRQISSPVRWTDTLHVLSGMGVAQVIECGPGKVLTTLNRRIERRPDLSFLALEDPESIDTALSATGAAPHA